MAIPINQRFLEADLDGKVDYYHFSDILGYFLSGNSVIKTPEGSYFKLRDMFPIGCFSRICNKNNIYKKTKKRIVWLIFILKKYDIIYITKKAKPVVRNLIFKEMEEN